MATKMKVLIGFSRMKEGALVTLTRTIIASMTGNDNFPHPTPTLEEMLLLLDDYETKLAIARKPGSPEDTALKDESKAFLIFALQRLGYYVISVANGQSSILLSSGFNTNTTPPPMVTPEVIDNVRLSDGPQSGQIRLDFGNQHRVRIYEYIYRQVAVPEKTWSDRFTTTSSRNNIISGLEPGHYYEVRVRAVNSKGAGDWSDKAVLLVR